MAIDQILILRMGKFQRSSAGFPASISFVLLFLTGACFRHLRASTFASVAEFTFGKSWAWILISEGYSCRGIILPERFFAIALRLHHRKFFPEALQQYLGLGLMFVGLVDQSRLLGERFGNMFEPLIFSIDPMLIIFDILAKIIFMLLVFLIPGLDQFFQRVTRVPHPPHQSFQLRRFEKPKLQTKFGQFLNTDMREMIIVCPHAVEIFWEEPCEPFQTLLCDFEILDDNFPKHTRVRAILASDICPAIRRVKFYTMSVDHISESHILQETKVHKIVQGKPLEGQLLVAVLSHK